jgi:hypothetical protein
LFYNASVVPDTASGLTYFLNADAPYGDTEGLAIDVCNQVSYGLVGTIPFLDLNSADAIDLVRWGSNGFAFRMVDTTGLQPSANAIVIVTSNLVGSTSAAPVPILASVSPSPVNAGGPAFAMQLIGSGFTSASTVLINGNPRVTTFVSSASLTAQVLASDITAIGQLSVQVTTPSPGGGTSDSVVVSINATAKTTPTVAVTPSSTSITTAQPLSVTVIVKSGSGNPVPTGTATLTSGGYVSTAATLIGGAATINIPAGSLALGTNTLLVTYLPDSAGSSTYNSASGSSTVTVATPIGTTVPTITLKPSSVTITNVQNVDAAVTVAGPNEESTPTGTVTLSSGSYSAQQTLSSGAASFSVSAGTLASGTNTLTASYAGDPNYASASGTTTITVSQVTISVPAPSPVSPGGSANATATLAAGSNYSGTMNLACTLTGSPTGAVSLPTCALNPASITMAPGGSGTTTLTINTTAASGIAASRPLRRGLWGFGGDGALLAVALIFVVPSRRRRSTLILVLAWLAIATGTIGCGGSGSGGTSTGQITPATTTGSYTFTVTGTDAAKATITSSASVTLTVQ